MFIAIDHTRAGVDGIRDRLFVGGSPDRRAIAQAKEQR
jgi:hypothetical protein